MLLRLNCHVTNLSASLEISLLYQAIYYYLLDNLVSGPLVVPTVIAALHPSNTKKRTDDYLWVINEVHVQTLRPSYRHGY